MATKKELWEYEYGTPEFFDAGRAMGLTPADMQQYAPGQLAQGQTEVKTWTPPAAGSGAVQGTPQGMSAAGQQQTSVPYADAASTYAPYIQEVMDRVLNRPAFSYDPETDPLYQSYAKQYRREGQRAAADTLGQAAALTGGRPSSWAVTASQQAGDRYAAALADKVPELRQLAYQMYADEGTQDRKNLDLLLGLADQEYQRGRDAAADEWKQREWDYGLSRDEESDRRYYDERDYERGRDAIADARYADETAYERGQQALKNNMALADLGISMGDYSLLKNLGFTDEQIAAYTEGYQSQLAGSDGAKDGSGKDTADAAATESDGGGIMDDAVMDALLRYFPNRDITDKDTWDELLEYYTPEQIAASGFRNVSNLGAGEYTPRIGEETDSGTGVRGSFDFGGDYRQAYGTMISRGVPPGKASEIMDKDEFTAAYNSGENFKLANVLSGTEFSSNKRMNRDKSLASYPNYTDYLYAKYLDQKAREYVALYGG